MKTINRETVNKFAGTLTRLDYQSFKIDNERKDIDAILLCELREMGHDKSIGCYVFEYPKNPIDDIVFLRIFSGTISHDEESFKLGKNMRLIQPNELDELISVSNDLLLAEKLPNFLSDSFEENNG